jgi:molybdopterin-guanine dinucleotide biosynthesis protein A
MPASAVVLAGGRSSRMGTPKALLLFDGQPLIVHVVATLTRLFDDLVVVASPGQDLPALPVTLVRDEVAYQGPVGGLCYGLRAATEEICFVSACDSAFLSPALISHLVGRSTGCDVVVPHWQGRFQPLHAVYRRSVLPLLEDQLARGELRPVSLFDRVRTLRIDEEEIRRFDSDGSSFFNMNTPADYQEALDRWRTAGASEGARQDSITCRVELFGVARLLARTSEVVLELPRGAAFAQLFGELARTLPMLVGRVITADRSALMDGYACSVNGREFVRLPDAPVGAGDNILILSADAGG